MATLYRRTVRVCTTCERRLDTTAARTACEIAGHLIRLAQSPIWWIRYQAHVPEHRVSARSGYRAVAETLLQTLVPSDSVPASTSVEAPFGSGTFNAAADALIADYRLNGKRSLRTLLLRLRKHLRPVF